MSKVQLEQINTGSVHKVFEEIAFKRKNGVAIKQREEDISYFELNSRANYLAKHLQSIGIVPFEIVAVEISHSVEYIISILAILKCGASYLPIDNNLPAKRVQLYLEATDARFIITTSTNGHQVYGADLEMITMEQKELFNSLLIDFNSHPVSCSDTAYIMFTSGSTGNPKGILVPHRAICRLVIDTNYIQIEPSDGILQLAPPSFDASTFEIWGALLNGATLVPYSGSGLDPNLLKNDIEENGVTILWLTAGLFHLVTDKFIEVLTPLRVLLAGGDVLNPKYVNKVLDYFEKITVINGYGPTENTTFTTCHVMTRGNKPVNNVPIGKAISGTKTHLLDEFMQTVKKGHVGELYTSGNGVALGYLNDKIENNCFFYDDQIASGLIYRTGDLVKENVNAELEFVGRKDNQIKIRGYRVSLEEVKTSLVELDYVTDAIVVAKKYETGDQILVAYIQTKEYYEFDIKEMKKQLGLHMPQFMIPSQFILCSKLPINSNGKIDLKLL